MRKSNTIIFLFALISLLITPLLVSAQEDSPQYVKITKYVVIRGELDPGAPMIESARAGDIYEVIDTSGSIWLTVKTKRGPGGYVPKESCRPVSGKSTSVSASPTHTFLFIALLFIAIGGGIFFFIRKNQHIEFE